MKSECHQSIVACCLRRLLFLVCCFSLTPLGALAAPGDNNPGAAPLPTSAVASDSQAPTADGKAVLAAPGQTGTLFGLIYDSGTKQSLSGVRVKIAKTSFETYTDHDGMFYFTDLPAGDVVVKVSYVGYPEQTLTKTITAGVKTRLDLDLAAAAVAGAPAAAAGSAVARSLNAQRAAQSLTSVVASDSHASMSDRNSAESLQRVAGVDIARDKGEGRFAIIRGLDPIYIGVSMNGMRMSSAEKASRESALDVLPPNLTSSLEVEKVTTPDMETDSIGGTNILTHTGTEQDGSFGMVTAGGRYAHAGDEKGGYTTAANYGTNQLLGGKLALAVAVGADERKYDMPAEPETTVWSQEISPTDGQEHWILGGQDFRDYHGARWRQGASISLDYKLSDTSKVWLRWVDAAYLERNNMWLTEFNFGAGTVQALTDTSASVTLPKNDILKEEQQITNNKRLSSTVGGYEGKFGAFTDTLTAAYTTGKYTRPTLIAAFANTATTGISYDFLTPWNNQVRQTSGPSISDPASYAFSTKSGYSDTTSNMHEKSVRDDLRYDFTPGGLPAFLKVGVEVRDKDNNLDGFKENITSLPWSLNSGTIFPGNDPRFDTGGFTDFRIRPEVVQSFYLNQADYGQTLNANTTYGGAFKAQEDIAAAYAMGGITLGKLKILAGDRLEYTHFWIQGWQSDATTGVLSPVVYDNDYSKALPAVILTYEVDPNTVARASFSTTLARPDYSVTAPGRAINDVAQTVTQGNPQLPPLTADNYDASIEHYIKGLGAISGGVFYKTIENFSYLSAAGTDPATGYLLTTYLGGKSAWVYGAELDWSQRFTSLPGLLSGLGAKVSGIDGQSEAQYPTRPGEKIPFTGFAKEQANVGLTYEQKGLKAGVSMHYHGKRLESGSTLGQNATQDQYEAKHRTVDANLSYTFKHRWQIYSTGTNLNGEPLKEYYGGTGSLTRIQTYEDYGWSVESGVKFFF